MKTFDVVVQESNGTYKRFRIVARNAESAANKARKDAAKFFGGTWHLVGIPRTDQ